MSPSELGLLVARLDDELTQQPLVRNNTLLFGFGGVVSLLSGCVMIAVASPWPGALLVGAGILQGANAIMGIRAAKRLRREQLSELHPQDADRLYGAVDRARKAIQRTAVRQAAAASLTRREQLLLDEVRKQLGIRILRQ